MSSTDDTGIAERVSAITQVDPYQASQLSRNNTAMREVFKCVIELEADISYPIGGDMDEVLRESVTLVPDVTCTVYERDHPRYDYLLTCSVDDCVYSAVTFTGEPSGVIEYLLRQFDESVGDVGRIRPSRSPPDYRSLNEWVSEVSANLGAMSLAEAIADAHDSLSD